MRRAGLIFRLNIADKKVYMHIAVKCKKNSGFTLVELLVVISIIALLLAVLMPSLQKARESGKRVVCGSRLHQIYLGHSFYAEDNRGRYLDLWRPAPAVAIDWSTAILFKVGGQKGSDVAGSGTIPENRVLNSYLANKLEIFSCPSDKGCVNLMSTYGKSSWAAHGNSYAYNGYGNNYGDYYSSKLSGRSSPNRRGFAGRKTSSVKQPAMKVLQGDLLMHSYVNGLNYYEYAWHSRDRVMANIVFGDGHVSYIRLTNDKNITDGYQTGADFSFLCD